MVCWKLNIIKKYIVIRIYKKTDIVLPMLVIKVLNSAITMRGLISYFYYTLMDLFVGHLSKPFSCKYEIMEFLPHSKGWESVYKANPILRKIISLLWYIFTRRSITRTILPSSTCTFQRFVIPTYTHTHTHKSLFDYK